MATISTKRWPRQWLRNEDGSVAIIFALVLIPVIGIGSAAIDIGRAAKVRSTLQAAVSAAAQAASAHLAEDRSVIEAHVKAMLAANLPPPLAELAHTIKVAEDKTSVEVAMETTVPTTLMAILGLTQIDVEANGFARPSAITVPGGGSGGPGKPRRDEEKAIGRAMEVMSGAGGVIPPTAGLDAAPEIRNSEDLRQAAREIAEKLRGLDGQLGGAQMQLPPEAAANLERMLRDLGRTSR